MINYKKYSIQLWSFNILKSGLRLCLFKFLRVLYIYLIKIYKTKPFFNIMIKQKTELNIMGLQQSSKLKITYERSLRKYHLSKRKVFQMKIDSNDMKYDEKEYIYILGFINSLNRSMLKSSSTLYLYYVFKDLRHNIVKNIQYGRLFSLRQRMENSVYRCHLRTCLKKRTILINFLHICFFFILL